MCFQQIKEEGDGGKKKIKREVFNKLKQTIYEGKNLE